MKKIMFNDKYRLTQAVLEGRKTQTRRLIKCRKTFKGEWVAGFNIHIRPSHFMDAYYIPNDKQPYCTLREAFAFAHLIDKVIGKGTWDANPYVWVYDFELIK